VDDPAVVGEGDRVADVDQDAQQPGEGEFALCRLVAGGESAQNLRQAGAIDQLHGEEEVAGPVVADVMHRDDAGVLELAGDLRLLDEALTVELVAHPEHDLHRHRAVEHAIDDLDDRAHATAPDLTADAVARLQLALLEHGGGGDQPRPFLGIVAQGDLVLQVDRTGVLAAMSAPARRCRRRRRRRARLEQTGGLRLGLR
jgi:hypothetical protein